MLAVAKLRRRRGVDQKYVRTKLWELRGEWDAYVKHEKKIRAGWLAELRTLEHGGAEAILAPYRAAVQAGELTAEGVGLFVLALPGRIPVLRKLLYGDEYATQRPRRRPPMPDFYHQRVKDLAVAVPSDLIPALVRGVAVTLPGRPPSR